MGAYVINICKDKKILACLYQDDNFDTYTAVFKVIDLINNYNKNLISGDLPDKVLAYRILQEENLTHSVYAYHIRMTENSYAYAESVFPKYKFVEKARFHRGTDMTIAICEDDIETFNNVVERKIFINIDTKMIEFENAFDSMTVTEYCIKNKINTTEFRKLNLPSFDIESFYFCFNMLDEFCDFINKKGSRGFYIGTLKHIIYSPIYIG